MKVSYVNNLFFSGRMEAHMIDFVEITSLGWKWIIFMLVCDWAQSCGFHWLLFTDSQFWFYKCECL